MARSGTSLVKLRANHGLEIRGQRVGRIVGAAEHPLVDYPDNPHGPLPAKATIALDPMTLEHAVQTAREVLLSFDAERSDRPVIVGLITPVSAPVSTQESSPPIEAHVDGKRMVIEAEDEIVLKCGAASITLRRNGRVVLRGTYVETSSEGVNRIKGGAVKIN